MKNKNLLSVSQVLIQPTKYMDLSYVWHYSVNISALHMLNPRQRKNPCYEKIVFTL